MQVRSGHHCQADDAKNGLDIRRRGTIQQGSPALSEIADAFGCDLVLRATPRAGYAALHITNGFEPLQYRDRGAGESPAFTCREYGVLISR